MSILKVGEEALAIAKQDDVPAKPKVPDKKVLDEDSYTEGLEKIIVRDFYPDLPKLKAQKEYLNALETNDTEKLREIHIKYGPKRGSTKTPNIYSTPATFETPDHGPNATPRDSSKDSQGNSSQGPAHNPEQVQSKVKTNLSLDKFLAKNTSEDNASFEEIMRESEEKDRQKHAWLYEQETERHLEQEKMLALPSIQQQAIEAGPRTQELKSWTYTPRNSLMYVPSGAENSAREAIDQKTKPREIVHLNTRFTENPFNQEQNKQTLQQLASMQAQKVQGKIGHDGKEILPDKSPEVNGYNFVATPSPAPGVNESPLMTWGEIEGTPFRLDGGDTPAVHKTPGPSFKIPSVPKRDKIAHDLAEKVSKSHRAKKEQALKQVSARFASPSPSFGSASKTDRLNSMSPAAQRLASKKLGIRTNTDKALRASYTPSPVHRVPGEKTPIQLTPGTTPGSTTPVVGAKTPKNGRTPKRAGTSDVSSLTDNLLNIPKRQRAQDFF